MNLLLLLSAMLSALSGAGLGVRAPQTPVTVNAVAAVTAATSIARVAIAGRPVQGLSLRADVAPGVALPNWHIVPAAPVYLSRRRE